MSKPPPSTGSKSAERQPSSRITPAEMEILRFVMDRQPVSVRDAAAEMARRRGLARTTVLTLMERLRAKGHLKRKVVDGVNQYELRTHKATLLSGLVGEFIDNALGGSLSPFVAYLTQRANLTENQAAELRKIVEQLPDQALEREDQSVKERKS